MSTIFEFLEKSRKRGYFWWFNFYKNEFINSFKQREEKVDDSWKGVKVSKTITPEGWTEKDAFKFLEEHYNGTIFKRFKD